MTYTDFIKSLDNTFGIVAHRGAWRNAPENSLLSLQHCIDNGYDIVEVDIQQSADGVLFVMHDKSLLRMVGVDIDPQSLTMQDLKKFRLKYADGRDTHITEQIIPTLEEFVDMARGKVYLDLDAKYRHLLPHITEVIKRTDTQDFVDIKNNVADVQSIQDLQAISDTIGCLGMPILHFNKDNWQQYCALATYMDAVVVESKYDSLDTLSHVYTYFKEHDIKIWVNTLMCSHGIKGYHDDAGLENPSAIWGRLFDMGVRVFQTDELKCISDFRNIVN